MAIDDSFDKQFFNQFLGKKMKIERAKKNITFEALAKNVGVTYSYLVNMFNGRQIASLEKWQDVSRGLGLSQKEFDVIFRDARESEIMNTLGLDISNTSMEDIPSEELEEVLFSKNSIELSEDAKRELRSYISFLKTKYPKR